MWDVCVWDVYDVYDGGQRRKKGGGEDFSSLTHLLHLLLIY